MDFKIMGLQESHAEEIYQILSLVYAQPYTPIGGGWSLAQIYNELNRGYGIGAFQEKFMLGFILYQRLNDITEVSILATHPAHQRLGVMLALLERLTKETQRVGPLWLEVHQDNIAARNMYEKLGFKRQGERPKYYRDGGSAVLYSFA